MPKPPVDEGTETSPDTRLVNAMESNPEFFKDPLIGQRVGKCKIEKYLGEGKTAVVYRAHYEPLNRTVAMKVLQPHMTKIPAVLRVFQQEGKAVAILDHENILKIYDVGEDGGHYYMVLELLRGHDLLKILEDTEGGTLDLETALDLTKQAARGLAAAHRKKLVHRDIKPQNLVIEPGGKLKIVDFGLAAEAEGAFAGGMLGTPHYMAPEQCRGEGAVTETDIYALGITLFHLLVGSPPFAGRKTKEAIIEGHLKGIRFEPEKINKEIPRAAGELVRRMTRMEASARPSAREVIELIEKFKPDRGEKSPAGRSTRVARRTSTGKSSAGLVIGAGAVVLLIVLFMLMKGGGEDDVQDGGKKNANVVRKDSGEKGPGRQAQEETGQEEAEDSANRRRAFRRVVQGGRGRRGRQELQAGARHVRADRERSPRGFGLDQAGQGARRGSGRVDQRQARPEAHQEAGHHDRDAPKGDRRVQGAPGRLPGVPEVLRVAEVRNEIKRFRKTPVRRVPRRPRWTSSWSASSTSADCSTWRWGAPGRFPGKRPRGIITTRRIPATRS